uniref:Uncharacterized protein n=1 Tax=Rhizophora mucronata TaxID=61149 RepID=A0A2P2P858_RHIMU
MSKRLQSLKMFSQQTRRDNKNNHA